MKSLISLFFAAATQAAELYDVLKSPVSIYNDRNFAAQVANNRQKGISVVHFYKSDGKKRMNSNKI